MLNIKERLTECLLVTKKYEWLLDSVVLDFYVNDHWSKLPSSLQKHFEHLPVQILSELLRSDESVNAATRVVWPLELLALRQWLRFVCISRISKMQMDVMPPCPLLDHSKVKHMFMKRVKQKKAHEIKQMASFCALTCKMAGIDFVLDFGAGLGHLARVLGYGYGINVCCFEMRAELNQQALIIDANLERLASKHLTDSETAHFKRPAHLTQHLTSSTNLTQFTESTRNAFNLPNCDFEFGIIGLHSCGDLGATLMRIFIGCRQAKFLNFVGCCYQKISTQQTQPHSQIKMYGYPLSSHLQRRSSGKGQLSYEAREIACHAIELYHDRLQSEDVEFLKIHSLRAVAERIIVRHMPELRHSALRNVKHTPGMDFNNYFQKAVEGTRFASMPISNPDQVDADLLQWRRIVCFYTLRLMLAPLVESIILYDRALYLAENGCQVNIEALFDPRISPRNHITSAIKSRTCTKQNPS